MKRIVLAFVALIVLALPARAEIDIKEITTPGGFEAWLVEEHAIPFVALELRFRGGAALDAPEKRGAVALMTALLEEGAGELDAQRFAEQTEALAASFSFDAHHDAVSVSARFLTENRDEAVALLRAALTEPRFAEDAVARVRSQMLSVLRSDLNNPTQIAHRRFDALAWGNHPYGAPANGTVDTVAALTRRDIRDAHAGALARDRVYISAVGDITADELAVLIDDLLGDLPARGAKLPEPARYRLQGGETVVPFNAPQSVAVFGHEGIPFDHPDFITAYVLNEVFGGAAESRLNREGREKRGLTYGIGTYLSARDHGALVLGQFATASSRMSEAIAVVREEWARIAEDGLSEQELADAKLYLTGAYPLRFDSNAAIADIMVGMQFQGQPADYIATRNDKVNAITLEDINRVARSLFTPEALHFVVVGRTPEQNGQ
ncbi:MAG: pitrilysin family protein [Paracoccaceae bacterium]